MSANLDSYLKALSKAPKRNQEAQGFADLMIGNRRGGGRRSYPVGVGGNGDGACAPPCPPSWQTSAPIGAPVSGPCPEEFLCDCDLIGANTLGEVPIASGGVRTLTVTNFDAVALQAVAIWITAFQADGAAASALIANPVVELPVVVPNVRVGNNGQLRTSGLTNALNSAAFAATREPVCVDWAPFRSQNGQELEIDLQNIVAGVAPIHVFVVLWCNILS